MATKSEGMSEADEAQGVDEPTTDEEEYADMPNLPPPPIKEPSTKEDMHLGVDEPTTDEEQYADMPDLPPSPTKEPSPSKEPWRANFGDMPDLPDKSAGLSSQNAPTNSSPTL
eukprot:gene630-1813_t